MSILLFRISNSYRKYSALAISILMSGFLCYSSFSYADLLDSGAEQEISSDDYYFDNLLLRGNRYNISEIDQFNLNDVKLGTYDVDIYLNNKFLHKSKVKFIQTTNGKIESCLPYSFLPKLNLTTDMLKELEQTLTPEKNAVSDH